MWPLSLGKHRHSGINHLPISQWDVLRLPLYSHLILRGKPQICRTLIPLLRRIHPPVIKCLSGLHGPDASLQNNQPVNSEGVAPESMHVGQGQQNDRRVQAFDLQPQVSPIRIPLSQLLIHSLNPEVTTKIIGIQQVHLKLVDIGIISIIDTM